MPGPPPRFPVVNCSRPILYGPSPGREAEISHGGFANSASPQGTSATLGRLTDRAHGRVFGTAPRLAFLQHSVADINEEMLLFFFLLAAIHSFPILFRFCLKKKKKKVFLAKGSDYSSVSHTINDD